MMPLCVFIDGHIEIVGAFFIYLQTSVGRHL